MLRRFAIIISFAAVLAPAVPCAAQAQIIRVGPDGDVADITSALATILAAPHVNNWIKVEAGVTTTENLYLPSSWTTGTIWLSGGWDAAFISQSGDPTDTTISGGLGGVVIDIAVGGGSIIISDLSIVDGSSGQGGGLRVRPTGTAAVRLDNLNIHDNVSISAGSGAGGGISAYLTDSTSLTVADCDIHTNVATGPSSAKGGGIDLYAQGSSTFAIERTTVRDNDLSTDGQSGGAGLNLYLAPDAVGRVSDCTVHGNSASVVIPVLDEGAGILAVLNGASELTVERTHVTRNTTVVASNHEQVRLFGFGTSVVRFTDSVIADGASDGIYVRAADSSAFTLIHLTVADHADDGIVVNRISSSTAAVNVSNTISFGNLGNDLSVSSGPVHGGGNLIGTDPLFTDPANLDYRFRPASPAKDAGSVLPPSVQSATDIRGGIRVLGSYPDVGAYEGDANLLFSAGFEADWLNHWSNAVGIPIS